MISPGTPCAGESLIWGDEQTVYQRWCGPCPSSPPRCWTRSPPAGWCWWSGRARRCRWTLHSGPGCWGILLTKVWSLTPASRDPGQGFLWEDPQLSHLIDQHLWIHLETWSLLSECCLVTWLRSILVSSSSCCCESWLPELVHLLGHGRLMLVHLPHHQTKHRIWCKSYEEIVKENICYLFGCVTEGGSWTDIFLLLLPRLQLFPVLLKMIKIKILRINIVNFSTWVRRTWS